MKSERKGEMFDLVVLEVMINIVLFTLSEMSTEVTWLSCIFTAVFLKID